MRNSLVITQIKVCKERLGQACTKENIMNKTCYKSMALIMKGGWPREAVFALRDRGARIRISQSGGLASGIKSLGIC